MSNDYKREEQNKVALEWYADRTDKNFEKVVAAFDTYLNYHVGKRIYKLGGKFTKLELYQAALVGLYNALKNYNPDYPFTNYATQYIINGINSHIQLNLTNVKYCTGHQRRWLLTNYKNLYHEYRAKGLSKIEIHKIIAAERDCTLEKVNEAHIELYGETYFEELMDDSGDNRYNFYISGTPDEIENRLIKMIDSDRIKKHIESKWESSKPRKKRILKMVFNEESLAEVGRELKITRSAVDQQLRKIREEVGKFVKMEYSEYL